MKKNVAVVGYGGQGGWHANHIMKSDVVSLSGIYDIAEQKCEKARGLGIYVYSSLDEVLSDKSVDIVVVATPNDSHREIAERAMRAGKNVICEKPVELSVAAFDEMMKVRDECGVFFSVHQNRRWDVDFLAMKDIITSDNIGEVINIESRIQGSRGIPSDWRGMKKFGGGMIYDWGVHLIDQMLQLIDEKVVGVFCETTHITNDEVDDGFKLILKFESGKRGYMEIGTYNFIAMPRFYMQCKNGSAMIEDWRQNAKVALLKAWNEKDVLPVETAAGITKTMAPRDEITLSEYEWERPLSDVHNFYRNFTSAIDGKEEQYVKNCEVRRVLRIIECAFASAEREEFIKTEI